ncbi:hypothetical protein [Arthrobacter sp. ERGS1:01]|uniref:hypothetical protein n=1 Tax=Arthrobacter sp. ERGS1:01 TaxID=1704044 RepID=UPI001237518B|nr:hypothetical protein [Arthrobacter sp. ERGS1:01]
MLQTQPGRRNGGSRARRHGNRVVVAAMLGLLLVTAASPAYAEQTDQSGVTLTVRIAPQGGCPGANGCPKPALAATGNDSLAMLAASAGAAFLGCGVLVAGRRRRQAARP